MNVFTHEEYLKEQGRSARRLQYIGLTLIVLSFICSFFLGYGVHVIFIYLSYPLLLIGLPLWASGRAKLRRLASNPRPDHLLNAELKGLNNKYSLHHFVRSGEMLIKHLLVMPSGLVVFESNDATGPVTCIGSQSGDRWRSPTNWLDRLTGLKPPVGNPSRELESQVAAVKKLVADQGKPDVPVKGFVVFTRNPDVAQEECTYPAIPLNETKDTVRNLQFELGGDRDEKAGLDLSAMLTSEDRRRLNSTLSPQQPPPAAKPAPARR
jgi:Nuclease-related domain